MAIAKPRHSNNKRVGLKTLYKLGVILDSISSFKGLIRIACVWLGASALKKSIQFSIDLKQFKSISYD